MIDIFSTNMCLDLDLLKEQAELPEFQIDQNPINLCLEERVQDSFVNEESCNLREELQFLSEEICLLSECNDEESSESILCKNDSVHQSKLIQNNSKNSCTPCKQIGSYILQSKIQKLNETTRYTVNEGANQQENYESNQEQKKIRWSKKNDKDMYKTLCQLALHAGIPVVEFITKQKRISQQKKEIEWEGVKYNIN